MTGFLKGTATATITPFSEKGVNYDAFEKILVRQMESGIDALVILGTTGEPSAMTEEEKTEVMRFAVRLAKGRTKLIFGTGSNRTERAVSAGKRAEDLGADGILAVTPYYNKCTQKGLISYYEEICSAVRIPVIAYNVPSRTGVNILPETMMTIAEIPNMAGIKEASGNMAQVLETARLIRGKCDLYSGEDALSLPILAAGGRAVISVLANLAPLLVKRLTDAVFERRLSEANRLNDFLLPLTKACFSEINPIPVKAGMNLLGFEAGVPRAPLTPLEEEHLKVLREAMIACGLEVRA